MTRAYMQAKKFGRQKLRNSLHCTESAFLTGTVMP